MSFDFEIAPAPTPVVAVDRQATGARAVAALALASETTTHAVAVGGAVRTAGLSVGAHLGSVAGELITALGIAVSDSDLAALLAKLDALESSASEILGRTDFSDHDALATGIVQ